MIQNRNTRILLFLILSVFVFQQAIAADISSFKKRGRSLYLIHNIEAISIKQSSVDKQQNKKPDTEFPKMWTTSDFPSQSKLMPIEDIVTASKRIAKLTEELESTEEGEKTQQIKFNLAYEFLLLYLHYQKEKFRILLQEYEDKDIIIPVTDDELYQYLLFSKHYLSPFIDSQDEEKESREASELVVYGNNVFKMTDDTSFCIRDNRDFYLNVYFLALMVECEILAGNWLYGCKDLVAMYDKKTWNWLDRLWRSYHTQSKDVTSYNPNAKTLYALYELYFRYNFLGRYLRNANENGPYMDTVTNNLLKRIALLHKTTKAKESDYYKFMLNDSLKDNGKTRFLPSLTFARRGYLLLASKQKTLFEKAELFELYHELFDKASKKVKYKIPLRSKIYHEIIMLGIEVDNLKLMENLLYDYGIMALRISNDNDTPDTDILNSSRLTMGYLLANILDKKRKSGMDHDSGKYRDLATILSNDLITKNNNWKNASLIHHALAVYYSSVDFNETFAMYHAKQAFLAPCQKITSTYGENGWKKFFNLPSHLAPEKYLKLFLYFHNKYPTSPDAAVPRQYKAFDILHEYAQNQEKKTDKSTSVRADIKEFLSAWANAWENTAGNTGSIPAYMSYFADDFKSGGLNKTGWKKKKTKQITTKTWINIKISNLKFLKVSSSGKLAKVQFVLIYKSSNDSQKSRITLKLRKEITGWKIVSLM